MNKFRNKNRRHHRQNGVQKKKKKPIAAVSASELVDSAEDHMERFELEDARVMLDSALIKEPDNERALELSATLLLEMGDMESARNVLQRAIDLRPDQGHVKFLNMAQLCSGAEACSLYKQGISIMECDVSGADHRRDISSAFCSLAELYMTDLCDEQDAETTCRNYIDRAIAADDKNPEAYKSKADLLLVLGDLEGAGEAMCRSTSLWLPQYEAMRAGSGEAEPLHQCALSYESRVSCVHALIECSQWETASRVLEGLLEEDDGQLDVWYLLGLLNYERGPEYHRNARFYWNRAKQVAVEVSSPEQQGDSQVLEHIDQLMKTLQPDGDEESSSDEGGEDEWTDEEDDAMEVTTEKY